jgi:hypothetical protein
LYREDVVDNIPDIQTRIMGILEDDCPAKEELLQCMMTWYGYSKEAIEKALGILVAIGKVLYEEDSLIRRDELEEEVPAEVVRPAA